MLMNGSTGAPRQGRSATTLAARAGALLLGAPFCVSVIAQSYPVKPVRVVTPVAPGGGTDTQARLIARRFQETFGQSFVVDNRAGASGIIGTEFVVKSPPDGYTVE
jgi:tripartite-type tricarboxylate transporter receptor subunit TctC